jgi:Sulfotransferase domain
MTTIDSTTLQKAYRASTSWVRLMPDFMIIGAQKGGTTSLYNYLIAHPGIAPIYVKEPHFFDIYYDKGLTWYRSHFPTRVRKYYAEHVQKLDFITGEASPYYLFHPLAAQRVAKTLPDVKLILVLRNPADRAYSQYQHQRRQPGVEPLSFEEAIEREEERLAGEEEKLIGDPTYVSFNHRHYSYLARGRYIEQVMTWMKHYPREQFLILKSEDLYSEPSAILHETYQFLQVPPKATRDEKGNKEEYRQFNKASYSIMKPETREQLVAYFRPYNARLYDYLERDFGWDQ